MSKFFNTKYSDLVPYTPGEQPKNMRYTKLNTNESPFPPSKRAIKLASKAAKRLELYPDPECSVLVNLGAAVFGVEPDQIIFTNGSDEILQFAFMAYGEGGAVFPNITYGFYSVFAKLHSVDYKEIPLKPDFTIDINDYIGVNKAVFIANPNAPTGIALTLNDIEKIVSSNKDNVVVIDEAYVDFGAESAVSLIDKYDNLLVVGTFSKSRSMAGARLGYGIGCKELIRDLNTIRYSTNPYNINRMTMAAGIGTLMDKEYTEKCCKTVISNREYLQRELTALGFTYLPSSANFIFAKHNKKDGEELYLKLKEKGVLVRHFGKPLISDYLRITIGTKKQIDILVTAIKEILKGV